jgi:hypothetical protein
MFPLTRILSFAAVGATIALIAVSLPARADELTQNLGPVGPYEPILTTVGNKRVIAFFEPDSGNCAFHAVIWNTTDVSADSAARFRAGLNPRQMLTIETNDNQSLKLQCGDNAERLAIIDNEGAVVTAARSYRGKRQWATHMKAPL